MKTPFRSVVAAVVAALLCAAVPSLAEETLEAVYARYVTALLSDDMPAALASMNAYNQGTWKSQNEDQHAISVRQWKDNCYPNYTAVRSDIKGNKAFLYVKATGKRQGDTEAREREGKVGFVKENGEWRIYTSSYD